MKTDPFELLPRLTQQQGSKLKSLIDGRMASTQSTFASMSMISSSLSPTTIKDNCSNVLF
jgi:hypothetical protein